MTVTLSDLEALERRLEAYDISMPDYRGHTVQYVDTLHEAEKWMLPAPVPPLDKVKILVALESGEVSLDVLKWCGIRVVKREDD